MLSFMDVYSKYNQILIHVVDQKHTSFNTDLGLYHYVVMPLELNNAEVTYQRLVNRTFKDQIGGSIEVYVDDMLVKSRRSNDHIDDKEKIFSFIQTKGMKLGPL